MEDLAQRLNQLRDQLAVRRRAIEQQRGKSWGTDLWLVDPTTSQQLTSWRVSSQRRTIGIREIVRINARSKVYAQSIMQAPQ